MKKRFIGFAVAALSAAALAGAHPGRAQESRTVGEDAPEPLAERETLRLDGVIVAANPADSIALIRRSDARRGQTLRLGQEYAGHVLVEVRRDSVLLESAAGSVRLVVGANVDPGRERVAAIAAVSAAESTSDDETLDANEPGEEWIRRRFSRARARQRLEKEMPAILNETSLVPRIEAGEVRGLAVARVAEGTLLSEAGLRPGDVLLSINGEPLSGLDALWEVLARLRDAEEIRVLVDRSGETVRFAYALTN